MVAAWSEREAERGNAEMLRGGDGLDERLEGARAYVRDVHLAQPRQPSGS